ncbi:MAG TPA: PH domain-containing protein [Acidimicrobiia bacterium]|nr:PH domain-containing protein [Acidimicrobiia bacterium]
MAYPRELLNEGEDLSLDLRPHWWFFARNFLFGFVLLLGIIFIQYLPEGSSSTDASSSDLLSLSLQRLAFYVWLFVAVVWLVILAGAYLQWIFTLFVVTSDRIIYRSGVIAKNGIEIPLERLNNINFDQTIFERLIGAGTLIIESAGEDGRSTFKDVRHPDAVQQEINRCRETNDRKTAKYATEGFENMGGGSQMMSIPEQIEKLAQLRDQNVITEAEFLEKKQKLLDQM